MASTSLASLRRLLASRFVRNVAVVGGGIAAGQAISLAFTPFLTRLYGPEAFGTAAAFAVVVNIIMPLATLGYANAIVMPDDEEDAGAVARLSILCGLVAAPASLLLIHLGKPWLIVWTGLAHAPWVLYLVPLSLVVSAFLSVANQAAIRQGLYAAKAQAYVGSTFLTNLGKLAGGLLAPSGLLLILLTLAGGALNVLMQFVRVPRQGVMKVRNWFGLAGAREAAQAHRDFALYRMPQSILSAATVGLPVILLSSLFGSEAAGQYSLAVAALAAPVILLGQAVGDVFRPKVTRAIAAQSPDAYMLLVEATLGMSVAAMPFVVVMLWGDWLFPIVFGADWRLAGEYAQWLALSQIFVMASRASISAFPALKLQGFLLWREIVSVILRTVALYIGFAWLASDVAAVALFSFVGVLTNLSLICIAHRKLRQYRQEWISERG
jgi:O-antigen/teichoic acid export membrane protein